MIYREKWIQWRPVAERYDLLILGSGCLKGNIAAQVGHSRGSLTIDVYSHVLLGE